MPVQFGPGAHGTSSVMRFQRQEKAGSNPTQMLHGPTDDAQLFANPAPNASTPGIAATASINKVQFEVDPKAALRAHAKAAAQMLDTPSGGKNQFVSDGTHFTMRLDDPKADDVLVASGVALATGQKCTFLVPERKDLPWFLREADESYPAQVKIIEANDPYVLAERLKKNGPEMMTPAGGPKADIGDASPGKVDAFIGCLMSGLTEEQYTEGRGHLLAIDSALKESLGAAKNHCEGILVDSTASFGTPKESLVMDIEAIEGADSCIFYLYSGEPRPSGMWVEAGVAIGLEKPCTFLVPDEGALPPCLREGNRPDNVRVVTYGDHASLIAELDEAPKALLSTDTVGSSKASRFNEVTQFAFGSVPASEFRNAARQQLATAIDAPHLTALVRNDPSAAKMLESDPECFDLVDAAFKMFSATPDKLGTAKQKAELATLTSLLDKAQKNWGGARAPSTPGRLLRAAFPETPADLDWLGVQYRADGDALKVPLARATASEQTLLQVPFGTQYGASPRSAAELDDYDLLDAMVRHQDPKGLDAVKSPFTSWTTLDTNDWVRADSNVIFAEVPATDLFVNVFNSKGEHEALTTTLNPGDIHSVVTGMTDKSDHPALFSSVVTGVSPDTKSGGLSDVYKRDGGVAESAVAKLLDAEIERTQLRKEAVPISELVPLRKGQTVDHPSQGKLTLAEFEPVKEPGYGRPFVLASAKFESAEGFVELPIAHTRRGVSSSSPM